MTLKTSKIGEIIFGKFKTEVHATEDVKALLKKEKISSSYLIPPAWLWYDNELLEALDENGDGKIDEKFGTQFKIIYFSESENFGDKEQKALLFLKTTIKNAKLKYVTLKNL